MAKNDLLKEAIADAKTVRNTALANAKAVSKPIPLEVPVITATFFPSSVWDFAFLRCFSILSKLNF